MKSIIADMVDYNIDDIEAQLKFDYTTKEMSSWWSNHSTFPIQGTISTIPPLTTTQLSQLSTLQTIPCTGSQSKIVYNPVTGLYEHT